MIVFWGEFEVEVILEFGGFSGHLVDELALGGTMLFNQGSIEEHLFIEDVEGVVEFIDGDQVSELLIGVAALTGVAH